MYKLVSTVYFLLILLVPVMPVAATLLGIIQLAGYSLLPNLCIILMFFYPIIILLLFYQYKPMIKHRIF